MTPRLVELARIPSRSDERKVISLVFDGDRFGTHFGKPGRRLERAYVVRCDEVTARGHYYDAKLHGEVLLPFPEGGRP